MTTDSSNQLMPLSLSAPGVNLGAYISTVNQIPRIVSYNSQTDDLHQSHCHV